MRTPLVVYALVMAAAPVLGQELEIRAAPTIESLQERVLEAQLGLEFNLDEHTDGRSAVLDLQIGFRWLSAMWGEQHAARLGAIGYTPTMTSYLVYEPVVRGDDRNEDAVALAHEFMEALEACGFIEALDELADRRRGQLYFPLETHEGGEVTGGDGRDLIRLLAGRMALASQSRDERDFERAVRVMLVYQRAMSTDIILLRSLVAQSARVAMQREIYRAIEQGWLSEETIRSIAAALRDAPLYEPSLMFDLWHAEVSGGHLAEWLELDVPALWQERIVEEADRYVAGWRATLLSDDPATLRRAELVLEELRRTVSKRAGTPNVAILAATAAEQGELTVRTIRDQHTRESACRAILDLELYRREHGAWPATLDALGRDHPDHFARRAPLRFERTSEGFRLWSVGPNAEDDGGESSGTHPETLDLVFWPIAGE